MLTRREPVTVRSLVATAGVSTMAVYTHFGDMAGLWRAVRQEGFTRLARRVAEVAPTRDPIRDLAALGAAYVSNALANPHLYRVMFDAGFDLEDPEAAAETFRALERCAERARDRGRLDAGADAAAVATRFWIAGHGITTLVINGVLPVDALGEHVLPITTAIFVAGGDDPDRCQRSVRRGWATLDLPGQ